MFEKFGEFHSAAELNEAAAGFLEEGDRESIFALAQENGLDREDAEDYIEGMMGELASPSMAAAGRIAVWRTSLSVPTKDFSEKMAGKVILDLLQTMILDPEIAEAVMQKSNGPEEIYGAIREEARKHASGTGQGRMAVACGTDRQLEGIIRTYFLESKKLKARIAALYTVDGEGKR